MSTRDTFTLLVTAYTSKMYTSGWREKYQNHRILIHENYFLVRTPRLCGVAMNLNMSLIPTILVTQTNAVITAGLPPLWGEIQNEAKDRGESLTLVTLDAAKAFDVIWQGSLLRKTYLECVN